MAIVDVRCQMGSMPIWGTPFTEGHLNKMLERYSIDRCVASASLANSADFIRGNALIGQVAGKGRIFGCVVVNTQYPKESIEDMRQYLSLSSFVALQITAGATGRPVSLDQCDEILNAHRRFGKPVLLDTEDRESVLAAAEIAKAFPGIKFVLLSMGGSAWRTCVALAERQLNLVLEISGNLCTDKVILGAETVGAHRMVYGSNMPFSDPSATIGLMDDAGLSDTDKRLIMVGTAAKVFGWTRQRAE